jgi:cell division protein FtsB
MATSAAGPPNDIDEPIRTPKPQPTNGVGRFAVWLGHAHTITQIVVGLIGVLVVLGLIGATSGAVVNGVALQDRITALEATNSATKQSNADLELENAALETEVERLNTEIASLREELRGVNEGQEEPGQEEAPTETSTDPSDPGVRRTGLIEIVTGSGNRPDLDAHPDDSNWGRENSLTGDNLLEGPILNGSRVFAGTGELQFMGSVPVNYATCADIQNYDSKQTPVGQLVEGSSFCIQTSASRFGAATVVGEPNAGQIALNVTIWKKAGD